LEIAFRIRKTEVTRTDTASAEAMPIIALRYTSPPRVARSRSYLFPMTVIPVKENGSLVKPGPTTPRFLRHDGLVPKFPAASLNASGAMMRFAHAKL